MFLLNNYELYPNYLPLFVRVFLVLVLAILLISFYIIYKTKKTPVH